MAKARPSTRHLEVGEASALVRLPDGRFLVADDELGLVLAEAGGAARALEIEGGDVPEDLEGLCLTDDASAALVVSEARGEVHRIPLVGRGADLRLGVAERLGSLPRLCKGKKKGKRKGWEGLALLPARFAPGRRDCLLAVHEARPRMVGLFALPSLEVIALLEPPADADELADLSDVAVDARSGRLLLLSDESQRIVVAELEADRLVAVSRVDLPVERSEKPEGLDVDAGGSLWVVCDGTGRLLELELPG